MAAFVFMILSFWANGDREAVHKVMSELDVFAEQRRYSVAAAFSKACAWFLHAMDGILEEFPSTGAMWSRSFFTRFGSAVSLYRGLTQPDLQPDISLTGRLVNALSRAHAYNLEPLYENYPKLSDEVLALRHEASIDMLADLLEVSLYLQELNRMGEVLEELRTRPLTRSHLSPEALLRPPARVMGEAAAVLSRPEEARALYEENTAICEEIGHRPELALTHLDLAELLLDHYPEEHEAAIEHLDFAIVEFRDMKMQPALERALGRRGLLKA
jgi:tetratricopeptide (TPR) repeat protein